MVGGYIKANNFKNIKTKKCLDENRKREIDFEFWRWMIKKETQIKWDGDGSGGDFNKINFISGWIIYFFPFDKKGKRRDENILKRNKKLGFLIETDCKNIPGEIQCVPVRVVEDEYLSYDCFLYNGFLGFERDNNQRMKTVVGWFLAE